MKEQIAPVGGPPAVGPYSPALKAAGFVFVSGQIPLDGKTGQIVRGPLPDQVHLIMKNMQLLLETAGSSLQNVVKTTIFLADINNFETVNNVYGEYFEGVPPARSTVEVSRLPKGVEVEIDAIALA